MTDHHDANALAPVLDDAAERRLIDVLRRADERGLSLAAAESCTGGLLASLLTDVKDRSGVFERGFVTYSELAKCELLGIPREVIDQHGDVSREVAVSMAEGALSHSAADVAVSTTGYADDGPEPGLVHFACAATGRATLHRVERFGPIGRDGVRQRCIDVVLELLDEVL